MVLINTCLVGHVGLDVPETDRQLAVIFIKPDANMRGDVQDSLEAPLKTPLNLHMSCISRCKPP